LNWGEAGDLNPYQAVRYTHSMRIVKRRNEWPKKPIFA